MSREFPPRLLAVDGAAGGLVGAAVVVAHPWLADLYALAPGAVLGLGVANLAYGAYSGTLAVRALRGRPAPRPAVAVLVVGNVAWGVVCVALAAALRPGPLGLAHLLVEGAVVGGLGVYEGAVARRTWSA